MFILKRRKEKNIWISLPLGLQSVSGISKLSKRFIKHFSQPRNLKSTAIAWKTQKKMNIDEFFLCLIQKPWIQGLKTCFYVRLSLKEPHKWIQKEKKPENTLLKFLGCFKNFPTKDSPGKMTGVAEVRRWFVMGTELDSPLFTKNVGFWIVSIRARTREKNTFEVSDFPACSRGNSSSRWQRRSAQNFIKISGSRLKVPITSSKSPDFIFRHPETCWWWFLGDLMKVSVKSYGRRWRTRLKVMNMSPKPRDSYPMKPNSPELLLGLPETWFYSYWGV